MKNHGLLPGNDFFFINWNFVPYLGHLKGFHFANGILLSIRYKYQRDSQFQG